MTFSPKNKKSSLSSAYKYLYSYINQNKNIKKNFIKSSLLGFVVGDALGVPVEFLSRNSLKTNPINDMIGYGTHKVPKGTWSDDTSLILATMDSIITKNKIDYEDIMSKFNNWVKYADYTATNNVFDIGISTRQAIHKYQCGYKALDCGLDGFYDNGNGSLMRLLPIVFYLLNQNLNFEQEKEIIDNISSLTHAHEISKLGCRIYYDYIKNLIAGSDKIQALVNLPNKEYLKYYSPETLAVYGNILNKKIFKIEEKDIKSSGFIVDTLESVLWAIINSNTFTDAILKAVNLGEDTDTIGALTGGLAGIIYANDNSLIYWSEQLQNKEKLYELIDKFELFLIQKNSEKNIEIKNSFKMQ